MGDEAVVVQIIRQICDLREALAFHNDKSADHGFFGEAPPGCRPGQREVQTAENLVVECSGSCGGTYMSKISKSIVISEFLWLLFFAVVFLKFDYTRTTLAVVNAIVWLCIVLVFSIIILQFLTRQAFTKVRGILLVLIFLIIDQVIKALLYFAPSEISIPVIPNILSILVILNKYQTLVLQAADKFASPYIVACAKLLLLPFFLLLLYLLSKSKNRFNFKTPIGYAGVTLISSAILSTVLDSLIYKGTPDYFYLIPLYSSVDLKDVFAFLGAGCILSIISTNEKNMQKKTTNMEAK